VTDSSVCAQIFKEIDDATRRYGLPALPWQVADNVAILRLKKP
jgi:hypothetical protein